MYLAYLDESGSPSYKDSEHEYVLTALIIHELDWFEIDKKVSKVKKKYFPDKDPRSFEIHATDIFNGNGIYEGYKPHQKIALFEDVINLIAGLNCCIISVVVRKNEFRYEPDFMPWAIDFIFERICAYLKLRNNYHHPERHEMGILFFDKVSKDFDKGVRNNLRKLYLNGTKYVDNDYLIEEPFFLDSAYAHLGQLVDCAAYCIRRKHRIIPSHPDAKKRNDILYDKIKCKIPQGGYGIKFYP